MSAKIFYKCRNCKKLFSILKGDINVAKSNTELLESQYQSHPLFAPAMTHTCQLPTPSNSITVIGLGDIQYVEAAD